MIAALPSITTASAGVASNSILSPNALPGASAAGAAGNSPFGDLFKDAVGQVSQLEDQARVAVTGLMTGSGVDVHQAMIASEKANMAFEMVLAVRNKAVQSYQSVMSMQF
jgi:flagellar hook-basal body complex protein FliE